MVTRDGVELLEYLLGDGERAAGGSKEAGAMPALVVLGTSMPRAGGAAALRRIRAEERTRFLPVVVFSSARSRDQVEEAYALGANSFVDKASSGVPYPELVSLVVRHWLEVNETVPA